MANEAHLNVLRQGTPAWNNWRQDPGSPLPDLSGADFNGANLTGVDLSDADLHHANLHRAMLSHANLSGADLGNAILSEAHLDAADLREAHLGEADLRGAELSGADLSDADLGWADLSDADLQHADLRHAILRHAQLVEANLARAQIAEAIFSHACLVGAQLPAANLAGAYLRSANLSGVSAPDADFNCVDLSAADLHRADLQRANLGYANLCSADLAGANLSGARLNDADLRGADLNGARLGAADLSRCSLGATRFGELDLRRVQGLETVRHLAPSVLGVGTLYKSAGQIPALFLQGCGVPDSLVGALPSLVGTEPILPYCACFISYASPDEEFVRRLHARLLQAHFRVWFAPEDVKTGDRFHTEIDEVIRVYDKLVLVLSAAAVASPWVEHEIRLALKKEAGQGGRELLPIRLDDTILAATSPWACDLRQRRAIGDFTQWRDQAGLERAFQQLLLELRAS